MWRSHARRSLGDQIGDLLVVSVPGGIYVRFSGQGVWHADGRQLQRLGLQPTVEVRPTLLGIRSGQDEVLQAAIEYLQHVPQELIDADAERGRPQR